MSSEETDIEKQSTEFSQVSSDFDTYAALMLNWIPSRPRFFVFGDEHYVWSKLRPWMPIAFTMGVFAGNKRDIGFGFGKEFSSSQADWVETVLATNPRTYGDFAPNEGRTGFQSSGSYWDADSLLRSQIRWGFSFGQHGRDRSVELAKKMTTQMLSESDKPIVKSSFKGKEELYPYPSFDYLEYFIGVMIDSENMIE
jgi:hypothetical protein